MHLPNIHRKEAKYGRFVCAICPKVYRQRSTLKRHCEVKHQKELWGV
jgi:hypothetical protein